ncbi:MAG: pyridoxal phosphate-dependent aminotransferase [Clostridiales bacterium]|nr:pyridoxal phosphate-dependent aminotransferase [Clostridiales bacterium]
MLRLGTARSEIRELFEYGKQRAAIVGAENVFDFSIGNPSVPPPDSVNESALSLLQTADPLTLHGYTSAQGDAACRAAFAENINLRFGTSYTDADLYLTAGAAAALCCCLHALACPGDRFVVLAPFFPEYKVFVEKTGAEMDVVPPEIEAFQIDFDALERTIDARTKGILINSPNNPSGAVYSVETVQRLADLLKRKSEEVGHVIWLISDEPYREITYVDGELPWLPSYYDNTLVCYSFSKSLSLPGERLGYVLVPPAAADADLVYAAVAGAGRSLGYVCAPSLFQRVTAACVGQTADLEIYKANRRLLLDGLRDMGFYCAEPGGTFYLFPRTLEPDARAFSERAKKYDLLVVPGDSFGAPGHVRISYCVPTSRVERALPLFAKLAAEYR